MYNNDYNKHEWRRLLTQVNSFTRVKRSIVEIIKFQLFFNRPMQRFASLNLCKLQSNCDHDVLPVKCFILIYKSYCTWHTKSNKHVITRYFRLLRDTE